MDYEMRVPTTEAEAVEILKSAVLVIFGQVRSYRGEKNGDGERLKGWNGDYVDHVKAEADGALEWLDARNPKTPRTN